jgi:hypothetical protein
MNQIRADAIGLRKRGTKIHGSDAFKDEED